MIEQMESKDGQVHELQGRIEQLNQMVDRLRADLKKALRSTETKERQLDDVQQGIL